MRHPSVRGIGIRYLIAALLPMSGAALVVYTAIQVAIAHVTNSVPPPRRISDASLPLNYVPEEPEQNPAGMPGRR